MGTHVYKSQLRMRVLDLFSGIGGFSLGLRRVGMRTVAFCEIDGFCRKILSRHWSAVPILGDITQAEFPTADIIVEASPAKTCPAPGNAPALLASVLDCTGNWCAPFAWYDQNTRSWRTWQRSLLTEWELFSGTWPRAGLILNGIAYRRAPSAPLMREIASGLLLTPRATDADKGGRGDLLTVSRGYETKYAGTLPTPTARDWRSGLASPETRGKKSRPLNETVSAMAGNRSGRMNPRFREVDDVIPDWMDRIKATGNTIIPLIPELIGEALMDAARDSSI